MVEWKYINEIIVSLKTGLNPRQNFRLNTPESIFPYITGKDIFNNKINVTSVTDRVDSKAVDLINKRANLEDNLLLFASTGTGTVGRMAIIEKYESDWAISETLYAIKTTDAISPQFLMYSLYSDIAKKQYEPKISKGSVPHLKIVDLLKVKIPIPSLEEQTRIVGILDTFTSAIDNLKEQIAQRKKQYEYYRDQLLDLEGKPGVEMKTLGDIMQIVRGASPRPIKNFITTREDGVNWIKIGDVAPGAKYITCCNEKITKDGAEKSRFLHVGDFILSNSMSFGRPYILKIDGCIHDGWIAMSDFGKYVLPDFLYEYLNSDVVQKYWIMKANNGGAMTNLNSDIVKETPIRIPSFLEQQRIVSILDTFEASIRNLEQQLALREKQYEYYRNKLLTFD